MTNVVYPAVFRPKAEPCHTQPCAEPSMLLRDAGVIAAAALGAATVLAHAGKKDLARERLLNAARDLAEMSERCALEQIATLAGTLARAAQGIRIPRRRP